MNTYQPPRIPNVMQRGIFMPGTPPVGELPESKSILSRWQQNDIQRGAGIDVEAIKRGEFGDDIGSLLASIVSAQNDMQRSITSATSSLPIRENLEAEAKVLIPLDTPFRNMLKRTPGSGLNSRWKQLLSLGGGYMAATTTTGTNNAAATTVTVASTAGMQVGDQVAIDTGANFEIKTILTIPGGTSFTCSALSFTHTAGAGVIKYGVQGGSSQSVIRAFFAETGSPADHSEIYAEVLATYKLLGVYGSVTGFAMAAGNNFQNQYAQSRRLSLQNLMLNEEYALINGSTTDVNAPWGDGTTNFAFNGIVNLVTTANGTPTSQVQTSVGALTTLHIDQQLNRLFLQGANDMWMLMNPQEATSLTHLAEAGGSINRVNLDANGLATLGITVGWYAHPTTNAKVKVIVSRFLSPGTIIFGCNNLPDGSPAIDVDVLPQVNLPQLAPDQQVQGYVQQELAPALAQPQVYPWITTVYEVLRVKSALHFAKSTGVLAV